MRLTIISCFMLALFLCSCEQFSGGNTFSEIEEAEYSRKIESKKMAEWLNSEDPEIRLRAVEMLGRIQDSSQVIQLANRLSDDDARVRYAAIFALGQLFAPEAEPYLTDALLKEADKENRLAIITALGKTSTNKNPDILKDFVESSDPEYQQESAIASGVMAYRGYHPHQLAFSLGKLMRNTGNPGISWRGAYAVYRIGALRSFNDLTQALRMNDPITRFFALKGMDQLIFLMNAPQFKQFRTQPAMQELLRVYSSRDFQELITNQAADSTYWYIRLAAAELMGNMENQSMQNALVKMLDDSHPSVQIQAIKSLGNYKNWLTRKEMRRIYKDSKDWRIRGEALVVLSLVQPNEALEHVKKDLIENPWPLNYYAIRTLDSLKTIDPAKKLKEEAEATELLQKLADNENMAQTTLALEVLVDRPQPPDIDFFIDKLRSGDPAITTIVASYLALVDDPRPSQAVTPLVEVYKKFQAPADLEAMEAVITALDSIDSQEAVPFLREQLQNRYQSLQKKATRALEHITKQKDVASPIVEPASPIRWDFKRVNPDSSYRVRVQTTAGDFTIELQPEKAPVTVGNFISLIENNFYNNIFFHRVVPGFVIQAGDPRGDGWGGSGYAIPCEYNDLEYDRGVVGMALSGKDTGSSQFFITQTPQPHLNGNYTIFGSVVSGMDVVDRIMMFDKIVKMQLSVH